MKCMSLLAALALLLGSASDMNAARKGKHKRAKKSKPAKVLVAHSTGILDDYDPDTGDYLGTYYFYNVIKVSVHALKKGHSLHDDVIEGDLLPDGTLFDSLDYDKGDKIELFVPAMPVAESPPVDPVP